MRSQACIIIVALFIAIVVLANGRADLENAMLVVYAQIMLHYVLLIQRFLSLITPKLHNHKYQQPF